MLAILGGPAATTRFPAVRKRLPGLLPSPVAATLRLAPVRRTPPPVEATEALIPAARRPSALSGRHRA